MISSLDCRLQLAYMKLKSLVIVGQPRDDESILGGLVHTSHHNMEARDARSH